MVIVMAIEGCHMVIIAQLQHLFTQSRFAKEQAQKLYIVLVEAARNPVFYVDFGVPDTLDGRFDMITLHMFLTLGQLDHDSARLLTEAYLADMDRSLREMGVGDTGVSRRVQKMASGFYGRLDAYAKAGNDPMLWQNTLRRNVYGTVKEEPNTDNVRALADYAIHAMMEFSKKKNGLTPEDLTYTFNSCAATPK